MIIRTATEADLDLILSLVNVAFQVENFFKNQPRLDSEDLARHFREGAFLLAEEESRILGCVYVHRHEDRAYFGLLSIDPARQKSGIGRRLVAGAEEFARETGARFMDLKLIHLRTELPGIYEKMGYHLTGIEPYPAERNHMITQPVHFLCMTKELGHR